MKTSAVLWSELLARRKRRARIAAVACFTLVFIVLPVFYIWSLS